MPAATSSRIADETKKRVESAGAKCLSIAGDLTNPAFCDDVVEQAVRHFGKLDILVANAGGPPSTTFETTTYKQYVTAIELNLLSSIRLAQLVVPGINQSLPEVDITFREVDNPTHVTLMSDRNFDTMIGFLWGPPGYSMDQWIFPFYHSAGSLNYGSVNDPELDVMLVNQRKETNADAKLEIWKQVYDRIHDKVYQAWFPEQQIRAVWHNYFLNYRTHGWAGTYTCYAADQSRAMWIDDGSPWADR